MDELFLMLEGIANKVKKLMLSNQTMKERIHQLELERQKLLEELKAGKQQNEQMSNQISYIQATKVIECKDTIQAKHKVNELLREIEKCYELIKSQA